MAITINTKERIEVVSTGKNKNKRGVLIQGEKGHKFTCHPLQAENFLAKGWIEDFTGKKEKKDDKK